MRKFSLSLLCLVVLFCFFSSQISGQTWSALKRLTWNIGSSELPSIATDSGNVIHAVWFDEISGNNEIFHKRSSNSGTSWSANTRLTWNTGDSFGPSIAVDSSNQVHLVWYDLTPGNYEIFYKRSTDGGATWSALKRLTWNSGESQLPSIATDTSNRVHVTWYERTSGNNEIFYKRSTDGGVTWLGTTRLTWNGGLTFTPSIATDSGKGVHVVWHHYASTDFEIYYKHSTDGGATWSGITRLTWNTDDSIGASIAVDSSKRIHVAWDYGTPGLRDIYYKRSTDGGDSWSGITRLTWNSGDSYRLNLATDTSNGIHIVWTDNTPSNYEIFYKLSTNSGVNWSGAQRLTWNSGVSDQPDIAADSNNDIHVIWQDSSPGNSEIFYRNRK
jgi:hypothetical protein